MTIDTLWQMLIDHQNETFYTMKKLPFCYQVKGGEIFVDKITGPKSLNVFGAPYVWAILKTFSVV